MLSTELRQQMILNTLQFLDVVCTCSTCTDFRIFFTLATILLPCIFQHSSRKNIEKKSASKFFCQSSHVEKEWVQCIWRRKYLDLKWTTSLSDMCEYQIRFPLAILNWQENYLRFRIFPLSFFVLRTYKTFLQIIWIQKSSFDEYRRGSGGLFCI